MSKMNWDRVAREDRLRRFLAGPEAEFGAKHQVNRDSGSPRKPDPIRVTAGDICTCCGRPFREGDPYYFTMKGSPRHHPTCLDGR